MLKPYSELVKVDVTKYCKKRDGMDYLNWAKCVELLHEHGAETVYFEPMVNEHGSSLFMSDQVFGGGKEGDPTNRCYEVGVTVHVDDNTWEFRGPLMNGKTPVKDNSLTQQRVWNAQTRRGRGTGRGRRVPDKQKQTLAIGHQKENRGTRYGKDAANWIFSG